MRHLLIQAAAIILLVNTMGAQETHTLDDPIVSTSFHSTHAIKIGTSIQFYPGNGHYYYDSHSGYEQDYQDDRYRHYVSVSYEYAQSLANNKMALGLEPKIGLLLKDNASGGHVGTEIKFYWVNTSFYRMGIALNVGYTLSQFDEIAYLSLDDGMYMRRFDYQAYMHSFDTDFSIIPFHFKFKDIPLSIESQVSFIGFSVVQFNPEENHTLPADVMDQLERNDVYPYIPKFAFKIGYVIK